MPHRTSVIKSRTRMALYLTISVLVIAYLAYFMVYVRGKEQRLDQKGVRTLQSIHNQMREKDAHYFRLIEDAYVWEKQIAETKLAGLESYHENFRDRSLQMLEVKAQDCEGVIPGENRIHLTTAVARASYLIFSKKLGKWDSKGDDEIKNISPENVCTDNICLKGKVALSDYMKGLDDNEFFEATALIHGKEMNLLYSSPSSALPSTLLKGNVPALSKDSSLVGVTLSMATLNGIIHRVYALPVTLGDQTAYLVGFTPHNEFIQASRSIGLASALVLALVVLALIAALPLIRIHVINGYERLDNADLVYGVLGLMALAYVGITICCVLLDQQQKEAEAYFHMEEWNDELSKKLKLELKNLQDSTGSKNAFFHEKFTSNQGGQLSSLVLPIADNEPAASLTEKLTNIKARAYHQELMQPYGIPYQWHGENSSFYLESVYSYGRGCHEAVLSWKKPETHNSATIQVITTDLKTLMLAKPPQNFHYVLFNDKKRVLFSSRPSQNNFSELDEEITPQHFIDKVILTGEAQKGDFEFFLNDYYGYAKPLDVKYEGAEESSTKPLYLLTYIKQQPMEWQLSNNLILSGASGFFLLALLMLVRLVHFMVASRRNKLLYKKRFSYHWFWPGNQQRNGLQNVLVAALGLVVVMLVILIFGMGLPHLWVTFYVLTAALVFSLLRTFLISRSTAPLFSWQWLADPRTGFVVLLLLWTTGVSILPAVIFYRSASNISAAGYGHYTYQKSLQTRQQAYTAFKKKYAHNKSNDKIGYEAFATNIAGGYAYHRVATVPEDLGLLNGLYDFHNRFAHTAVVALRPEKQGVSLGFHADSAPLWAGIILILMLLYQLVFRTTGLVFGRRPELLNLPKGNPKDARKEVFRAITAYLVSAMPPYSHLLLIGAPGARRSAIINKLCARKGFNFQDGSAIHLHFNTLSISEPSLVPTLFEKGIDGSVPFKFAGQPVPQSGLIVIHGLANDASNLDKLEVKFAALEIFIQKSLEFNFTMCVLSHRKGDQFKELLDHPDLKDTAESRQRIKRCIARWEAIMANFRQFIVPINPEMWKSRKMIINLSKRPQQGEKFDVALTHEFGPLYMAIWGSLTQREKFMVYDLLEDDVVNQFDRLTLQNLACKGIIHFDTARYRFRPFHSSFGFFVNQNVLPAEIERIHQYNKPLAAWSDVRLAMVLLIAGALGLVYFMNQDVLTIFSGIVGGVIVAFTGIARIIGSFNFQALSGLFGKNK